jgi:hypothetical protein
VARRRAADLRRNPVLNALTLLSEGQTLTPDQTQAFMERGSQVLDEEKVRFVVIDRGRASDTLRELAIEAFHLRHIASDGPFELYQPDPSVEGQAPATELPLVTRPPG